MPERDPSAVMPEWLADLHEVMDLCRMRGGRFSALADELEKLAEKYKDLTEADSHAHAMASPTASPAPSNKIPIHAADGSPPVYLDPAKMPK